MNKKKILLSIPILAVFGFFLGPKVDQSVSIKEISVSENPEEYIQSRESVFKDIKPDSEKKIIWNDPSLKKKTEYSIVYIHGYSANRLEISPVCDILARDLKANLFYTRLSGHGREDMNAFADAAVNDWINDAVEAVRVGEKIGEKVIIIGTSTGATLGTWIASEKEYRKNIAAFVFLSPNFHPHSKAIRIGLYPWGRQIARLILGETREWTSNNEKVMKYWNHKYPSRAIVNLIGLVDYVSRKDVSGSDVPILVMYSPKDAVISVEEVQKRFQDFGGKNKLLVPFTESQDVNQHVLAGDIISPSTNRKAVEIIEKFFSDAGIKLSETPAKSP